MTTLFSRTPLRPEERLSPSDYLAYERWEDRRPQGRPLVDVEWKAMPKPSSHFSALRACILMAVVIALLALLAR